LFAVSGPGQVGGTEPGVPKALEVVLGPAQIQGEGVVEQAEAGECLLQPVDGAGGGLEDLVQVAGGGVVGGALGDGVPLLAFAPPVQQIGARDDELAAAFAVQLPWAGAPVDDGLEGAEPAVRSWCETMPGQVTTHALNCRNFGSCSVNK
jgi:hypothetical protein